MKQSADALHVVDAMIAWWNQAFAGRSFSAKGFAYYFAPDAEFHVDEHLRGRGPEALDAFFSQGPDSVRSVTISALLPDSFSCGPKAFIHYLMEIVGPQGGQQIMDAKGRVHIEQGKITHYAINTHLVPCQHKEGQTYSEAILQAFQRENNHP